MSHPSPELTSAYKVYIKIRQILSSLKKQLSVQNALFCTNR